MAAIWFSNVSKKYPSPQPGALPKQVLDKVNLMIMQNELLLIWGPTGTGKSTLLRLLAGLEVADEGRLIVNGHEMALNVRDPLHPGRDEMGFVLQDNALTSNRTVEENLALPLQYHLSWRSGDEGDSYKRKIAAMQLNEAELSESGLQIPDNAILIRDKVDRHMHKMLISEHSRHRPPQLSKGVQKRVAIARATVLDPKILLLDEPTAGLDLENRLLVLALLSNMTQIDNKTLIIVTHDYLIARDLPYAKIVVLKDGHLTSPLTFGEMRALYEHSADHDPIFSSPVDIHPNSSGIRREVAQFFHYTVNDILSQQANIG